MKSGNTNYRNQAARNVLAVLDEFTRHAQPLTAGELCEALGMTKNMIQRALVLLEEEGFVRRDRKGHRYHLGPQVLALASSGDEADDDIQSICRPAMQQIHALTQESVFLGIIVGHNRVVIDIIEGSGRRVAHSQKGLAVPLHVSKASRVLLAALSNEEISMYLAQARPLAEFAGLFSAAADETLDDVWADVEAIRRDGYIAWSNSQQYGGSYIAFPVHDGEGRPHAVLSVGAPIERVSVADFERLLPQFGTIMAELGLRTRLIPAAPLMMALAA